MMIAEEHIEKAKYHLGEAGLYSLARIRRAYIAEQCDFAEQQIKEARKLGENVAYLSDWLSDLRRESF